MPLGDNDKSRFVLRSAIADYEANRAEEARTRLLGLASDTDRPEPEVFHYLELIALYEAPTDLGAAKIWRRRFVDCVAKLADEGDVKSQLRLASMAQFGDRVPMDPAYARDAFKRLAESGNPEAQYRYATMHNHGQCGVVADQEQYMYWLSTAVDSGFPEAQHELALVLLSGERVSSGDRAEAIMLLRRASQAGWAQAAVDLEEFTRASS